jgi:predicted RNA-binding Zn-ribbon protein involved in translation (DUF1610 family)
MKKAWKWILGIVIGLIIVAVLVTIGFMAFNRWGNVHWMMETRNFRPFGGEREMPVHPYSMMPRQMVIGFSPLRLIGGLLFYAVLAFLVVLGVISLVRGNFKSQKPTAVSAQVSTPVVEEIKMNACPNCGHVIQQDWSHCAYCGNKLS